MSMNDTSQETRRCIAAIPCITWNIGAPDDQDDEAGEPANE